MSDEGPNSTPVQRRFIPTLDGWRTIAIGLVLGSHLTPVLEASGSAPLLRLARVFSHAGYGVDIFFSISGYLICTLLLIEKGRAGGRIDLGRFYTRRVFRIFPPLMAYLAGLVVLRGLGLLRGVSNSELTAALGFARNYSTGSWYTGQFWSLAIEEHFYLVIPILFSCLRWRAALLTAAVLSAWCVAWRSIEFRYGFVQSALPWSHPQFRTENRIDALMNGAILALLLHRGSIRVRVARALSLPVMIVLAGATVGALTAFPSQPARRTIVALVVPLFLAWTVLRPTTPVGRVLDWGPIRWVGRLSYSLYLWQELFLIPGFLDRSPDPLGRFQRSSLSLVAAFACAIVSYYLIEKPMIRVGHRLTGPRPRQVRAADPELSRIAPAEPGSTSVAPAS